MFVIKNAITIILMLSIILPGCSSTAVKHNYVNDNNLSPRRAMNINWNDRQVTLTTLNGDKINGYLQGWSTNGFILNTGKKIEMLPYESLRDYIIIQTRDKNSKKGAKYGFYSGLGLAAASSFYLLRKANNDNNEKTVGDPLVDDAKSNNSGYAYLAIITAPLIVAVSTGVGSLIGNTSYRHEKYYFNTNRYSMTPYMIDKPTAPPQDHLNNDNR